MYEVIVIQNGYSQDLSGQYRANGTITLIKGSVNIIVDTGSPCELDKKAILTGISRHGLSVSDIHFVVATHGHIDHVGNLNLFPSTCTFIVGYDIYKDGYYLDNGLSKGESYELDDTVYIMPTPGHTCHDVSVVVKQTIDGTVVVTGDLFESEDDLTESELWRNNSHNPSLQEANREKILHLADVIIPGHGERFIVKKPG